MAKPGPVFTWSFPGKPQTFVIVDSAKAGKGLPISPPQTTK